MLLPEDLFAVSDALQMELEISENGSINGRQHRSLTLDGTGMKLNMKLVVVSSKVKLDENKAAVNIQIIVHVHGDLYMYVFSNRKNSTLTIILFDRHKFGEKPEAFLELSKAKLAEVAARVRKAAVAEYSREDYDMDWKKAA